MIALQNGSSGKKSFTYINMTSSQANGLFDFAVILEMLSRFNRGQNGDDLQILVLVMSFSQISLQIIHVIHVISDSPAI